MSFEFKLRLSYTPSKLDGDAFDAEDGNEMAKFSLTLIALWPTKNH